MSATPREKKMKVFPASDDSLWPSTLERTPTQMAPMDPLMVGSQPTQPTQPSQPTQPTQPTQPSKPTQPTQTSQPTQPSQLANPLAQSPQPSQRPAQPPAKPIATTETGSNGTLGASDLDLLLIGKTGVGKSATGNSILGRKAFQSSASLYSVTDKLCTEVADVRGRVVKVVDAPGVGDTRMDVKEGVKQFMETIQHAMISNPAGYHALLLVVRFGSRFTKEDEDTVDLLKKVFGEDFVQRFCVVVITCGDNFQYEAEETGLDFPGWVAQQTGAMAKLVAECQGRVVLFDNRTRDTATKTAQVDGLFKTIEKLDNGGQRYTDSNFQKALELRQEVIAKAEVPIARDETVQAISLLLSALGSVRFQSGDSGKNPEVCAAELEKLLGRAQVLEDDLVAQDKGTGALKDLLETISTTRTTIQTSLEMYQQLARSTCEQAEKEEKLRQEEQEKRLKLAQAANDEEARTWKEECIRLQAQLDSLYRQREMDHARADAEFKNAWQGYQQKEKSFQEIRVRRERSIISKISKMGGAIMSGLKKFSVVLLSAFD